MAGNYSYSMATPGSEVADQLQEILARKRQSARQDMLDEIQKKNIESEIATRAEQADTNKAYREAWSAEREDIGAKRRAEANQLAQESSALDNLDTRGYPEDVRMQLELAKRFHNPSLAKQILVNMKPNPKEDWVPVLDAKGDTVNWAPANSIHLPQPQQTNAANAQQLYQTTIQDPEHPGQSVPVSYWLRPGEMPNDRNRIVGGPMHHDRQEHNPPKPFIVPQALSNNLAKAQAFRASKPNDPAAMANLRQAQINVINAHTQYSPELRDTVSSGLDKAMKLGWGSEQVIQAIKTKHPDIPMEDENALRTMFSSVLGK